MQLHFIIVFHIILFDILTIIQYVTLNIYNFNKIFIMLYIVINMLLHYLLRDSYHRD